MADKRRPRKKGQHRNSPSHDDLFTDENKEITLLREYIRELLAEDVRKVGPNKWCPFIDDKVTRADQEADRKAGRPVRKHRSYKRTKTGKIRMKRVDGGCGTKDKANRTMAAAMQ